MPLSTGGPLFFPAIRTARVISIGAVPTDLLTIVIPPGFLKNDGDQLLITASCILAGNANNKTTSLIFGATSVTARGPAADNGLGQVHEAWITRLGASSQQGHGVVMNGITATVVHLIRDAMTEDCNAPITVKLQATGTADSDIISRFLRVAYLPVAYLVG